MNLKELENLFISKLTEKYKLTQRDIKKAFTKFDKDNSGYLNNNELAYAISLYCNGVNYNLINELVKCYDVDQDGVISLEEFSRFLLSRNSSNPSDWITVDHLTSNNQNDSIQHQQRRGRNQNNQNNQRQQQQQRNNNGDNEDDDEEEENPQNQYNQSTLRRNPGNKQIKTNIENPAEHFAKLFLQGMKSVLTKQILDDREAGRIPSKDRLTQKTSSLIETQSKLHLQRLFSPYITSNSSKGISLQPFKRILSKFVPPGAAVYDDNVFEYIYQLCCPTTPEKGATSDLLFSLLFDNGTLVENRFGFVQDVPPVTNTGRPEVGKGPFTIPGVDAGLKTAHAPPTERRVNSVIATQISDVPLRFMTKKSKTTLAVPSNFSMESLRRSSQYPDYECEREFIFGLKTELYSGRSIYRYPTPNISFHTNNNNNNNNIDNQYEYEVGDEGNEKIIYCTAALGIVHDLSTNTQRTFCGHDDDITCISLAPGSLGLVATGQLGRSPYICIWDCSCLPPSPISSSNSFSQKNNSQFSHNYNVSRTGLVCSIGKGFFQRAVCAICFSYDGKYLCAIGCDDHHSLGIWEIGTGTLVAQGSSCNGTPPQICSLSYCPLPQFASAINKEHNGLTDTFCTAGVRHLKFWSFIRPSQQKDEQMINQLSLTMKTGTMGKVSAERPKTYLCSIYIPTILPSSSTLHTQPLTSPARNIDISIVPPSIIYDILLGADNGWLYLFHQTVCIKAIDLTSYGINTVSSLDYLDTHIYVGGSQGLVLILNPINNFEVLKILSILPSQPTPQPTSIISNVPISSVSSSSMSVSSPSPRSSTPSRYRSSKISSTPQSRPRSSSTSRNRPPSSSNQSQIAAGGRSSQPPPNISRKGRSKAPSSGWNGPGDKKEESLPQGVKASTDVKGMVLIPRSEGLQKRIEGSFYSSLSSLLAVSGFGKVLEIKVSDRLQFMPSTPILSFAYGPLYGLAVSHYPRSTLVCVGGDDKWLSLYSIATRNYRLLARTRTPSPIRCIDFESKNIFIAVGMMSGVIGIYFLNTQRQSSREQRPFIREKDDEDSGTYTLHELITRKDCEEDISDIKFSPNSRMLAVGSHDNYIDIYTTSFVYPTLQDPPTCNLQQIKRLKGHTSYLTHLDWSLDNTLLRSTCGAYELLYWSLPSGKMCLSSFDTTEADTVWYTNNCVLGFNVMGIWPEGSDGTDINCVDSSEHKSLVATGDDFGNLSLFNYPCVVKDAPRKIGYGHSSHVMNIKFTCNESQIITVGGNDNSIIVWKLVENNNYDGR